MRINVYSQELTSEVKLIGKESNTGLHYSAVQLMLHSSPMLHHPPEDDDRSAVTFWLPKSAERREALARAFEEMANVVRFAPPERDWIEPMTQQALATAWQAYRAANAAFMAQPPEDRAYANELSRAERATWWAWQAAAEAYSESLCGEIVK